MFPRPIITAAMSAPGQPGSPSARLERGKSAIGDRFGAIRERMASVRYLYEYRGGGAVAEQVIHTVYKVWESRGLGEQVIHHTNASLYEHDMPNLILL